MLSFSLKDPLAFCCLSWGLYAVQAGLELLCSSHLPASASAVLGLQAWVWITAFEQMGNEHSYKFRKWGRMDKHMQMNSLPSSSDTRVPIFCLSGKQCHSLLMCVPFQRGFQIQKQFGSWKKRRHNLSPIFQNSEMRISMLNYFMLIWF